MLSRFWKTKPTLFGWHSQPPDPHVAHQEIPSLLYVMLNPRYQLWRVWMSIPQSLIISIHELPAGLVSNLDRHPHILQVQSFPNAYVPLVPLHETLNSPIPNVHTEDLYIFQLTLSSRKPLWVSVKDNIERRVEMRMQSARKETISRGAVCAQIILGWGNISEMHAACLFVWAELHLYFSRWYSKDSFHRTLAHRPESSQTLHTNLCS